MYISVIKVRFIKLACARLCCVYMFRAETCIVCIVCVSQTAYHGIYIVYPPALARLLAGWLVAGRVRSHKLTELQKSYTSASASHRAIADVHAARDVNSLIRGTARERVRRRAVVC